MLLDAVIFGTQSENIQMEVVIKGLEDKHYTGMLMLQLYRKRQLQTLDPYQLIM